MGPPKQYGRCAQGLIMPRRQERHACSPLLTHLAQHAHSPENLFLNNPSMGRDHPGIQAQPRVDKGGPMVEPTTVRFSEFGVLRFVKLYVSTRSHFPLNTWRTPPDSFGTSLSFLRCCCNVTMDFNNFITPRRSAVVSSCAYKPSIASLGISPC